MAPSSIFALFAVGCAYITASEQDQRMSELCLDGTCATDTASADTSAPDDTADTDDTGDTDDTAAPMDGDGDGYTADQDCDDGDASIHPDATEIWYDGIDQDCDGLSDYDADLDGDDIDSHGGGDCDDADAAISSLATEQCCDGVDNDCDEDIDEDCVSDVDLANADATWEGSHDSWTIKRLGMSLGVGDIDDDGADEIVAGSDRGSRGEYTGMILVFEDQASGDHTADDAVSSFTGDSDRAGYSVAVFDADGDGDDDILTGGPEGSCYSSTSNYTCGGAWLIAGPITGADLTGGHNLTGGDEQARWMGDTSSGYAGRTVAAAGPWAGSSYLAIGAPADLISEGPDATQPGCAYLVAGTTSGTQSLGDADMTLCGADAGDDLGAAIAAQGSISGDGDPDIVVGAPWYNNTVSEPGNVYAFKQPWTGSTTVFDAEYTWEGRASGDAAGYTLLTTADLNHDGNDDLVISAVSAGPGGEVYVLSGGTSLASGNLDDADAILLESRSGAMAGEALATSDVDGDGVDDLVVSAPRAEVDGNTKIGVTYVMYGPLSGTLTLGCQGATLTGPSDGDTAGSSLATGDLDHDGFGDVLVGSPQSAGTDPEYSGRFYLLHGDSSGL